MFTAGLSGPLDPVVSLGAANVVGVDDAGPEDHQQQHNSEEESSDEEMVRALFKHFVSVFFFCVCVCVCPGLPSMFFCLQDTHKSVACRSQVVH